MDTESLIIGFAKTIFIIAGDRFGFFRQSVANISESFQQRVEPELEITHQPFDDMGAKQVIRREAVALGDSQLAVVNAGAVLAGRH